MKFMEKLRDTLYAARNAQALLAEPRALRKTRAELMAELTAAELRERQYQRGAPRPAREAPEASRGEDRLPPAAPPRPQREGPGELPVGRLDFLDFRGEVAESMEYTDEKEFLDAVKKESYYGSPMRVTVYSDPVSGAHMDTSWRLDLDPPPQGFSVTPYQPPEPEIPEPEMEM